MPDFLKSHGGKVVVGVLVVLNMLLIAALMIRQRDLQTSTAVPAAGTADGGDQSESPAGSSSPSAQTTPDPSAGQQAPNASDSRLLAADSERVAWRTMSGGCDQPSSVQVTTNGGDTWTATDPGIRSIVRLKAFGSDAVFAIGADQDCKPTYAWIDGPDKKWHRDASKTADKWYRVPGDLSRVHDPAGDSSMPCGDGLTALAGLGTYQAAVLCDDGRIRTRDQGQGWQTVAQNSRAVALNADNSRFVAAIDSPSCSDGLAIRTFDVKGHGLGGGHGRCRLAPKRAPANVAVSNIYTMVWLWSGKKVTVSP